MSVFIIAEAGVNHNGDIEMAKKLIETAAIAGADCVKFQTFKAEKAISRFAKKAEYQMRNLENNNDSQLEMVRKLELSPADHDVLMAHCKKHGIAFLSTPFDHESVDLLDRIGMQTFKIPSGEITNLPYLRKIGALNKRIILSSGMANLGEVEEALDVLTLSGTELHKITVLHANTEYPTPFCDVNLKAMVTLGNAFGLEYGYSDHTPGIEVPIAAVALGASVIEKHFTLDRNLPGPDHKASLEPDELFKMVKAIRNIEEALGSSIKRASNSERKNMAIARKSIVAAKTIKEGDIFTVDNITTKRPGTGISPMQWDFVLGRSAIRHFEPDELIEL